MPPIHFNHVFIVIDSLDINALKKSGFVNNELAAFSTRTTIADSGLTWTGSYIYGIDNYLEIFQATAEDPLGNTGIAFSVDGIGDILKTDSMLKRNYKTELGTRERKVNGKMIPWFTSLAISDSVFFSQSHIYSWLMEYKQEYFDYNHFNYNNRQLTRAAYLKQYDEERRNKVLKRFTGITLNVTEQERKFYTGFLLTCGYKKINANRFTSGDGFIFTFRNRNKTDRCSITSLEFDANNSDNKTVRISEHINVVLSPGKGKFIFSSK